MFMRSNQKEKKMKAMSYSVRKQLELKKKLEQ
jgi:hypothetical protein